MHAEAADRAWGMAAAVDAGTVALLGGRVPATEGDDEPLGALLAWLRALGGDGARWWRTLEWTDRALLDEVPPSVPDLPRFTWGRWWCGAGDLEVWRDGVELGWRFVGDAPATPPPGVSDDFFARPGDGDGPPALRPQEGRAFLWAPGDPQVATADAATLAYLGGGGRKVLHYTVYHDRGVPAAVRYREITTEGAARQAGRSAAGPAIESGA